MAVMMLLLLLFLLVFLLFFLLLLFVFRGFLLTDNQNRKKPQMISYKKKQKNNWSGVATLTKWNMNSLISLKQTWEKEQLMCGTLTGPWELEYQLQNFGLWQLQLTVSSASASLGSSGSESGAVPETVLASEASSASATDAASCSHTQTNMWVARTCDTWRGVSHFCVRR